MHDVSNGCPEQQKKTEKKKRREWKKKRVSFEQWPENINVINSIENENIVNQRTANRYKFRFVEYDKSSMLRLIPEQVGGNVSFVANFFLIGKKQFFRCKVVNSGVYSIKYLLNYAQKHFNSMNGRCKYKNHAACNVEFIDTSTFHVNNKKKYWKFIVPVLKLRNFIALAVVTTLKWQWKGEEMTFLRPIWLNNNILSMQTTIVHTLYTNMSSLSSPCIFLSISSFSCEEIKSNYNNN